MRILPLVQSKLVFFITAIFLVACNGQPESAVEQESGPSSDSNLVISEESSKPTPIPVATQELTPAEATDLGETPTPLDQETDLTGESADSPASEPEAAIEPTITQEHFAPGAPEEIAIEAADGLTLQGTFYPASVPGQNPGLLLLHMNGGRRQDWNDVAPVLANSGYAVLTLDMRGHGQSGGSKDWNQAADDLQRAWAYLSAHEEVDSERTAIIGASIGANMALVTGVNEPSVRGVALLSPGLNYLEVMTNDAIVDYGNRPALIVASEEDTYAAESSRTLKQLAQGSADLVLYNGAGHGTRMFSAEPELLNVLTSWLSQHLLGQEEATSALPDALPAPELFDTAWQDRSPFVDGLIASEQLFLDQETGLSIYHMALDFSPDMSLLSGRLQVKYTNREDSDLEKIFLHLHANRLGGKLIVSDLEVNGVAVEPSYQYFDTVMKVSLPEVLKPNDEVILSMNFDLDIPGDDGINFGLLSAGENELALAHFYPQIAVYDEDGWNIDIPSGIPDITHSDSAYYLVQAVAPADRSLIASGLEAAREDQGDQQIITFAAGPARDFYITGSDRYLVLSKKIGDLSVNSYSLPEHEQGNRAALNAAIRSLQIFYNRIGPYPFTELDIAVLPSLSGGPALGIEYPGIVVINSDLYETGSSLGRSNTPAEVLLEAVVAHEVGHQWFYSTVGNDQVNDPWLDESLVQYITYLYYVDAYGREAADGFRRSLVDRWGQIAFEDIAIGMPAGAYSPVDYSAIVYGRGPLFFEALVEEMGQEKFDAFLADYYQQNKWEIATGEVLLSLAEKHCECDLTPLFAAWVIDS
jgi:pimeloyl-ACP methyl ester carboxylesterase